MNDGTPTKSPLTRAQLLARLTGAATLAIGSLLIGQGTSQLATLPAGTAGRVLVAQGAAAPAWTDIYAQANTWTAAQSIVTASATSIIRCSGTTNANACLAIRNDRSSGSFDLQLAVPGSAFTGYGLVIADSAVVYSQRSIRIVSDNVSGEIVLGIGGTGGSRMLTLLNGQGYFGPADPGGSELMRFNGSIRCSYSAAGGGNHFPGLFLQTGLTTGSAYIVVGKADAANSSAVVRYDGNNNRGGLGIYGSAEVIVWGPNSIGLFGATPVTRPTYAAPTGTATRTGFDTATVTLALLAQHVKAMIDDNRARGDYA